MQKSQNGKTVRLSSETIKMLGNNRDGFETPDECINRLLTKHSCNKQEDEVVTDESNEAQEE